MGIEVLKDKNVKSYIKEGFVIILLDLYCYTGFHSLLYKKAGLILKILVQKEMANLSIQKL